MASSSLCWWPTAESGFSMQGSQHAADPGPEPQFVASNHRLASVGFSSNSLMGFPSTQDSSRFAWPVPSDGVEGSVAPHDEFSLAPADGSLLVGSSRMTSFLPSTMSMGAPFVTGSSHSSASFSNSSAISFLPTGPSSFAPLSTSSSSTASISSPASSSMAALSYSSILSSASSSSSLSLSSSSVAATGAAAMPTLSSTSTSPSIPCSSGSGASTLPSIETSMLAMISSGSTASSMSTSLPASSTTFMAPSSTYSASADSAGYAPASGVEDFDTCGVAFCPELVAQNFLIESWSTEEVRNFFIGVEQHGQKYNEIVKLIPSKTSMDVSRFLHVSLHCMRQLFAPELITSACSAHSPATVLLAFWKTHTIRCATFDVVTPTWDAVVQHLRGAYQMPPIRTEAELLGVITAKPLNASRSPNSTVLSHPSSTLQFSDSRTPRDPKQHSPQFVGAAGGLFEHDSPVQSNDNNNNNNTIMNFSDSRPSSPIESNTGNARRVSLQLLPFDSAHQNALTNAGFVPYIQLKFKSKRSMAFLCRHLASKWQSLCSAGRVGGPHESSIRLMPCDSVTPSWDSRCTHITAAMVSNQLGNPQPFQLRYAWFSSVSVPSTLPTPSAAPLRPSPSHQPSSNTYPGLDSYAMGSVQQASTHYGNGCGVSQQSANVENLQNNQGAPNYQYHQHYHHYSSTVESDLISPANGYSAPVFSATQSVAAQSYYPHYSQSSTASVPTTTTAPANARGGSRGPRVTAPQSSSPAATSPNRKRGRKPSSCGTPTLDPPVTDEVQHRFSSPAESITVIVGDHAFESAPCEPCEHPAEKIARLSGNDGMCSSTYSMTSSPLMRPVSPPSVSPGSSPVRTKVIGAVKLPGSIDYTFSNWPSTGHCNTIEPSHPS